MFNIIRYIILRWKLLKAVHVKGKVYSHPSNRRKLDKQVKDLAWLITKHNFNTPVVALKMRSMLTKKRRVLRYVEIKGNMVLSDTDVASFTISNNWGFGYKMVAHVSRNGKPLFMTHGSTSNCFDVIKVMGTKRLPSTYDKKN